MSKGPLNIAMLCIHSSPVGDLGTRDTGGMSVYIRELARELGLRGHRVDIYTRSCNGNSGTVPLYENVRLIHLSAAGALHVSKAEIYPHLADFFCSLRQHYLQRPTAYDIIHSHYWLSGVLGRWAGSFWNVPHVLMFHTLGAVKNNAGFKNIEPELRVAVEKKLSEQCCRIIVPSARERDNLLCYYRVSDDKIGVVACGVDLKQFRLGSKAGARKRLGFDRDEALIVYVGRFDPLKGIDRLLKAACHVKYSGTFRVVIIGGDGPADPARRRLQRLVAEGGLMDRVVFAGSINHDDLPSYYSAADTVIVPSYYESFGLVALEALACGTPVIAAPVGAMEDIIHHGQTGCIVHNPTPLSLAGCIDTFLSKSLKNILSPSDIRRSVLKFSWAQAADAILDEYRAATKKHRQPETPDLLTARSPL